MTRSLLALALASASVPAWASAPTETPAASASAPAPAPAPAPAAAEPTSRGWAHVAVDTSKSGEAGPALRRRVQERADVVLRRAGVMPGRGPQDPTINVVVREKTGDNPGWEYTITVSKPNEPAPAGETATCELCTETELVDAIEGRLATVAAGLDAEPAKSTTPLEVAPPEIVPNTEPEPTTIDDPGPPLDNETRLGGRGKAGAALLALGSGGLVAGIVLTLLPARPKDDEPTKEVFTQPPGYALLGAGAAALILGAVLLGLDRRQARRQSHARVRMAPGRGLGFQF